MSETTTATVPLTEQPGAQEGNGLFPVPGREATQAVSGIGIEGAPVAPPAVEAAPAMPALEETPPGTTDDTSSTSAASGKLDDPTTWAEKKDERSALQTEAQNTPPTQPLHRRAFGALKGALGFGGGSEAPTTPIVAPTPDHLTVNPASGALETPTMPNVTVAPETASPLSATAGTTPGLTTETGAPEPGSDTTRPMDGSAMPAFEPVAATAQPEAIVDAGNGTQEAATTEEFSAIQTGQAEGSVAAISDAAGAVVPGAENSLLSREETNVVADVAAPELQTGIGAETVSPPPFDTNAIVEQPSADTTGAPLPLEVRPDQANEAPTGETETSAEEVVDPLAVAGPTMPESDNEDVPSPTAPIEPALQASAGEAGSTAEEVISEVPENVTGIRPDTAIEPTASEPASAIAGMSSPALSVVPPTGVPAGEAENDPNSGVGNPPAMPQAA